MRKLIAKDLKEKFIEIFAEIEGFSYKDGNPFLIEFNSKQYFIFLKNLSPAYFKSSPDVTRVQLPYSVHFSKIFNTAIPFLVFGYDVITDTIVTWDPEKVKERVNIRDNVSLYSRYSLQEQVTTTEFRVGFLSNGEKIILFKRENLVYFFDALKDLYKAKKNLQKSFPILKIDKSSNDLPKPKLLSLSDKVLLHKIKPFLEKNQVLQAVAITSKFYSGRYDSMKFKDWYKIVNDIYKKKNK